MNTRVPELTGLRGVAVMMVVLIHAAYTVEGGYSGVLYPLRYFSNGGLGVQIFFVLSGFLITNLLHEEWKRGATIDLARFYWRRTLRIWPAFYAYILVVALLSYWDVISVGWQQLAFAALHAWNYSEALGLGPVHALHEDGAWYLGHFWSLSLEEQFYWFWPPLLVFLLRQANPHLLLGLVLLVPVVRVVQYLLAPDLRGQLGMMLHTGVDSVLIGCYAALNQSRVHALLASSRHAGAIVAACCAVLVFVTPELGAALGGYWSGTYGATFSGACVALVVVAIVHMRELWLSRVLRMRAFIFVGTISYSLYLWQQLFLYEDSPLALAFPLNIVQAFVAAMLSYWLIETPVLQWRNRRERRPAASSAKAGMGA